MRFTPGFKLGLVLALALGALAGCARTYYATWEKLGKEKRDLLRSHISQAIGDQEEASEQFKDALERLKALYGFEGGELEQLYDGLKGDYERSESKAADVRGRIERVEKTAHDLFAEWEKELGEIQSSKLRSQSRARLAETRARFADMDAAMQRAAAAMQPVLAQLKDYVLFLKHNLNARAIGSLESEAGAIETDVNQLIAAMSESIRQADAFIKELPD